MSVIQICGAAICCLIASFILKEHRMGFSIFLSILGGIFITAAAVKGLYPVIEFIKDISEDSAFSKYIPIMIKALGIAFAVQITSDICKDAGESGLASKLELFGKVQLIIISLPLISDLINLAKNLSV